MHCNNCGEEIKNNGKFCTNCGTEVGKKDEGLGTASMVIGIISLVLTFFINLATLPLSITGLILGIVNKSKKGKKVSGIILNAVSIVLSIIIFFILIVVGFTFLGFIFDKTIGSDSVREDIHEIYEDIREDVHDEIHDDISTKESINPVEGKYNCKNFDGTGPTGDYIVRFELDDDYDFLWGKYGDTYKNYVKGTYTYEDLDKKNPAGNYSYYTVSIDGDEFYQDGIKQTEEYASEYEFGITKESGKKQGILYNGKTGSMYYCYEE